MSHATVRLPAPWSDAKVHVYPCLRHICLRYSGSSATLIAAGAIEPHMALVVGRIGRQRVDTHGFSFGRKLKRNGSLEVTRFIESLDLARTLPGVPHDIDFEENLYSTEATVDAILAQFSRVRT